MEDDPVVNEEFDKFVEQVDFLDDVSDDKGSDAIHGRLCAKWAEDREAKKEALINKRKDLTRLFFKQKELYEDKPNRYKNRFEIKETKVTWLRMYREFLTELDGYDEKLEIVDPKRLEQMAASANYFNNDVYGKDFTR